MVLFYLISYFLFYFELVSSCVLLSLSTCCLVLLLRVIPPHTHLSHISLVNTAQFPVSLHLHLSPSPVYLVFKPV